jgi:hypothetical protein
MKDKSHRRKDGVSLAKGPVALIGLALLAYGILNFLFGGNGFGASPVDGTVNGDTFLGIEANGWTNVLFAGAGLLLLFGSPLHWGAKSMAMIVGLVLGAASVISMVDGSDVFGIFATNGPTQLALGAAATALLLLSLLPKVGKKKHHDATATTTWSTSARAAAPSSSARRSPATATTASVPSTARTTSCAAVSTSTPATARTARSSRPPTATAPPTAAARRSTAATAASRPPHRLTARPPSGGRAAFCGAPQARKRRVVRPRVEQLDTR